MNVRGKVLLNLSEADNSTGLAAFVLNRTYFKLRSHTKMLYSLGKVKGKDVFFTMQYSNLDAANADLYNNNVLIGIIYVYVFNFNFTVIKLCAVFVYCAKDFSFAVFYFVRKRNFC